jgi:hypothetical protein
MCIDLAEDEWIEEQLATNSDFDPNAESMAFDNSVNEQQTSDGNHPIATESTAHTTGQNKSSDSVQPTGNGEHAEGENHVEEIRSKPKRYVS